MTTMISCQIRHRVHFAPNPKNPSFGTEPYIVPTRLVRDLPELPPKVKYIFFDDVVEIVVKLPEGTTKTLYSKPVNEETFFVSWDEVNPHGVEVHANLQGKVCVLASQQRQLAAQKVA